MTFKGRKSKKNYFTDTKGKPSQEKKRDEKLEIKQTISNSSHSQKHGRKNKTFTFWQQLKRYKDKYISWQMLSNFIFNPYYFCFGACLFIVAEAVLNVFIIEYVSYTEIDWTSYMQEVEGFLNGTRDYTKLQGDTGPLVYPAGFVYIFSFLYMVTDKGRDVRLAQYIFAGVYLLTLALVFRIYHKSKKLPPYILVFVCCISYRIHSIFVLRLFNDTVAMMIFYGALNFFISGWWTLGSIFYSLAVSVKMNILLFSPALFMSYLHCLGFSTTIMQLFICASLQIVLGLPFLLENPVGYVTRAFDLSRIFLYEWTVNWRFLPEEIFVNQWLHLALLLVHFLVLVAFAYTHWQRCLLHYGSMQSSKLEVSCQLFLLPMFISNFIGMVFSRSLHYQFYVWYFHSIPYLLWSTKLNISFRLLLLGLIELCWNTFPSTWWSSALLQICHLILLISLLVNRPTQERTEAMKKKLQKSE